MRINVWQGVVLLLYATTALFICVLWVPWEGDIMGIKRVFVGFAPIWAEPALEDGLVNIDIFCLIYEIVAVTVVAGVLFVLLGDKPGDKQRKRKYSEGHTD